MKKSRFQQNLESLGFETYEQYLASDHWKNKKAEYANAKRPHYCQNVNCQMPDYILHHLTYERIGGEDLDDFLALCNVCHHKLHDFMRGTGRWLYKAKSALRALRRITTPREIVLHDLPAQPIHALKQYSPRVNEILAELHTFNRAEWRAISQAVSSLLFKANEDVRLRKRLKKESRRQQINELKRLQQLDSGRWSKQ